MRYNDVARLLKQLKYLAFSIFFLLMESTIATAEQVDAGFVPHIAQRVEVGFVYNFTKYITWPTDTFINEPVFKLCTLGGQPLNDALDGLHGECLHGESVSNLIIAVHNLKDQTDVSLLSSCHMLFIAGSEEPHLASIIAIVKNHPVLTVSNSSGFADRGVMINLYMENGKIRFEVNINTVNNSQLTFSSHLLKLARTIQR